MGFRLWGRTESDTTEATQQQQQAPRAILNEGTVGVHILCPSCSPSQLSVCISCGLFTGGLYQVEDIPSQS